VGGYEDVEEEEDPEREVLAFEIKASDVSARTYILTVAVSLLGAFIRERYQYLCSMYMSLCVADALLHCCINPL
jgi:hypothetical protein